MYNLIIVGYEDESWFTNRTVKIAANRFLEYTDTSLVEKFRNNIELTYDYPCLIMKEGDNPDIYVCKIISAGFDGRYYQVKFEIFDEFSFSFLDIEPFVSEFDIRQLEMTRTHWALKTGDLSELLKSLSLDIDKVKSQLLESYLNSFEQAITIEKKVDSSSVVISDITISCTDEKQNVESVTDFIQKIFSNQNDESSINFYRGHSNYKYKLEPSLFRKKLDGSFHYLENENTIYNELLTQNYSEFDTDSSTFDRLVRMQHFSLPTRLLDISTNPLTALYFACKGGKALSGDVISIQVPRVKMKYFDSDTATCIANLCKLTNKDKESLSVGELDVNHKIAEKKLYHCIKDDKPYFREAIEEGSINEILCIKGKITNSRINAQSGAFLLFGLDAVLEDKNNFGFDIIHYLIEPNNKEKILKELDLLNINESTLFPYLENSAKYISNKFQKN